MTKGIFITIEGPDGAGKTSVMQFVIEKLQQEIATPITATREPGGSVIAEKVRQIVLDPQHTNMDVRTEAILIAAARRQHLVEKILPSLEKGHVVLCDRFVDSSYVYQGIARGIGVDAVRQLNEFAIEGVLPAVTIYLDVPAEVGLARIQSGRAKSDINRLDQEAEAFHQQVRSGYLELVQQEPERFAVVDATQPLERVVEETLQIIRKRMEM